MSDCAITFCFGDDVIEINFPDGGLQGPPGSSGTPDLSVLDEYTDDAAAIADGLDVGDHYIIAAGSDVGPAGLLKRIMPST